MLKQIMILIGFIILDGIHVGNTILPLWTVCIALIATIIIICCALWKAIYRENIIIDEVSKNVVVNKYLLKSLRISLMKSPNRQTIYEVKYKNGKIVRTRNYDSDGNINIEQIFYDNEQVHYRIENGLNGKTKVEFDKNGKRM